MYFRDENLHTSLLFTLFDGRFVGHPFGLIAPSIIAFESLFTIGKHLSQSSQCHN